MTCGNGYELMKISDKGMDCAGNIEIIIADGGSTDSILAVSGKYTNKIYPE